MTGKRLFATMFVLVALVVWGATSPNVTVAQDRVQTRDQLKDNSCLTTPIQDRTRDQLHTSATTVVSSAQLQQTTAPTAAAVATLPAQTTVPTVLQTRQQVQTQTHVVTPSGNMIQQRPRDRVSR